MVMFDLPKNQFRFNGLLFVWKLALDGFSFFYSSLLSAQSLLIAESPYHLEADETVHTERREKGVLIYDALIMHGLLQCASQAQQCVWHCCI